MRVIHLACVAPPQIGGVGKVAAREVAMLRAKGVAADLCAPGIEGFPAWWRYGNTAIANPWGLRRLVAGYDIVHLHFPFYGTMEWLPLLRASGSIKRFVITLHMDARVEAARNWILDINRIFFQPWVIGSADALLVSSLDYARKASFSRFAASSKMHELPFGVDETVFTPGEPRSRFDLPAGAKAVAFIGGMDKPHAFKGVDVLLKAFAELPQDTWLVLGGEGELRAGYEKMARDLGIMERTKFLGRVEEKDLPDVYRMADVFAFPSVSKAEAFGLVAVEAQACGVPVVASELPGVRTVIEDKATGFLTPPGDKDELAAHLRLLLENPGMRQDFGRAARARVLEKFTWSKHLEGLLKIYFEVCASR